MKNVETLKALYEALGGSAADVANASTSVDVLNAIAAKYEGTADADLNPEAIANIAAVADNIGGGSGGDSDFKTLEMTVVGDGGSFKVYPLVDSEDGNLNLCVFATVDGKFLSYVGVGDDETATVTVVYTVDAALISPYNVVKSVTGSATYDSDTGLITATGDFTVNGNAHIMV